MGAVALQLIRGRVSLGNPSKFFCKLEYNHDKEPFVSRTDLCKPMDLSSRQA